MFLSNWCIDKQPRWWHIRVYKYMAFLASAFKPIFLVLFDVSFIYCVCQLWPQVRWAEVHWICLVLAWSWNSKFCGQTTIFCSLTKLFQPWGYIGRLDMWTCKSFHFFCLFPGPTNFLFARALIGLSRGKLAIHDLNFLDVRVFKWQKPTSQKPETYRRWIREHSLHILEKLWFCLCALMQF